MKKKLFFGLFFLATICVGITLGTSMTYVDAIEPTVAEMNISESVYYDDVNNSIEPSVAEMNMPKAVYYDNVNNSIELFDTAIKPYTFKRFTRSGEEKTIYDDRFGGVYIDDNGLLNIGVVGLEQPESEYGEKVILKPQNYSYNFLQDIQTRIAEVMQAFQISATALDEETNKVDIYMTSEEKIDSLIEYLLSFSLYEKDSLNFIVDANNTIIPTESTAYGGDKLNTNGFLGVKTYIGTMAVNAIDNDTGKYGILTNQHVADKGTMHVDGWLGTEIGDATKMKNSGTIDAAFVPFSDQGKWNTTTQARYGSTIYTNIKLGDENLTVQGLPTRKIGQSSGNTTGTITSRNYVCNIDYGSGSVRITNTLRYSNESIPGDSGGPVYYDGGGQNLWLIGINFAGPIDPTTSTYGIGCRITEVMREFNVTPIFNGTMYNTTDLANNEIRIDSLNITYPANPQNAANTPFTVPNEIDGRTVTEIGASAFANQLNITKYTLPVSLKIIGNSAFINNTTLSQITIPSTVTSVGANAFDPNTNVLWNVFKTTDIGTHEVRIDGINGNWASVAIPQILNGRTVTSIGANAFKGATNVGAISVPASVRYIEYSAFQDATGLTEVSFVAGSNLQGIGVAAFDNTGLNEITIPASVQRIEAWAFKGSRTLSNVNFPYRSKLEYIGENSFRETALQTITIPASVQIIADCAFYGLSSLTHVRFGGILQDVQVHHIGKSAFEGTSLDYIEIPGSVKIIDNSAFRNVTTLYSVIFNNSQLHFIGRTAFENTSLTYLYLPSSLTYIDDYAFVGASIVTLNISCSNRLYIGQYAFAWVNINYIYCNTDIAPTVYGNTFDGINRSDVDVYVCSGTINQYLQNGWVGFNIFDTL